MRSAKLLKSLSSFEISNDLTCDIKAFEALGVLLWKCNCNLYDNMFNIWNIMSSNVKH